MDGRISFVLGMDIMTAKQTLFKHRQVGMSNIVARETYAKQTPQPKTMNKMYGDGSNHIACSICGFCKTCKDCVCKWSVTREFLHHDYKKGYEQGLADERAKMFSELEKILEKSNFITANQVQKLKEKVAK